MSEKDLRLALLNTLLTTPHRELAALASMHKEMITQDPRFYVQLAAWYANQGDVRDHKEMFVIQLCLSQFEGHRDVGLALLRQLPPYQLARVVDFIKGQKVTKRVPKADAKGKGRPGRDAGGTKGKALKGRAARAARRAADQAVKAGVVGAQPLKAGKAEKKTEQVGLFVNVPRSMRTEVTRYLREREAHPGRLDSAILNAREAMKRLYAGLHIEPSKRAQAILFEDNPPEDSVLYAVKQIARATDPAEQARAIAEHKIPYRVAASLIKKMTPMVLAALVNAMSPQEVINNVASLKERGAMDNADIKKLIDAKLEAAKKDKRVSAYKAKVALEAADATGELAEQLEEITETQVKAKGSIKRPTSLLIDKCVVGDTLVCTEHGLLPIESLVPPVRLGVREIGLDLQVATRSGSATATHLYLNGTKPVRYLETEKGYRLGASLNHPVLCYQSATATLEWREAGTLQPGDYVALRRNTRSFGHAVSFSSYKAKTPYQPSEAPLRVPDSMSPELARWVGYVVSEGRIHIRPAFVEFINSDEQLVTDFCELTVALFGIQPRIESYNGSKRVIVPSEELLHFLDEAVGFRKSRSRDCKVPLSVLMSPEKTQRAFLRAYFAGDGGLMSREMGVLAATSASEHLLRTIQVMLLNFGIVSRLKPTTSFATNGSGIRREYWRLTIGGSDAERFLSQVGFASEIKHEAVAISVANGHTLTWSARWDSIPELASVIVASKPGMQSELRQAFPTVACFKGNAKGDRVPADLLPRMLVTVPSVGELGSIREIAESQLFLDKIAGITEGEEPVYDLCVPGDHSFISNGIVSHNSGSMHEAIEVGRQLGAMISAICESGLFAYAFDSAAYPVKVKGTSLADWEKALAGINAGGSTSCGVALEWMRKKGERVEQIIMVTDEGENVAPLFKDAYEAYAQALNVRPDVVFVKVGGSSAHLEKVCNDLGVTVRPFEFKGDYYALTNLIPLLTRPSMVDLLMEIMDYPLPERRVA
ncbi:MAG TPA: LAGLIDADG family homing endonuclease [Ktedonobacterales bacterium]|jgi:intein/homing endonuclease